MMPFMLEQYGNPHSRTHLYGWQSEEAVETARKQVAELLGADAKEIIFTSVRDDCAARLWRNLRGAAHTNTSTHTGGD
jgi:cysteine sulfinate desulfinase/cysteine desulfurase-like protein